MKAVAVSQLASLDRYFKLAVLPPGTASADLDELYALRYAVFCEECAFMPTADYTDGMEKDEFDARSAHVLARNAERRVIGTTRLVCAGPGDPFPYEAHCKTFPDFEPPDPREAAEVSRLAVHRDYRRRSGDTLHGVNPEHFQGPRAQQPGEQGADSRVNAPLLLLGLYREMYRYSRAQGIRYWYAAMEKSLERALAMYGFVFKPIGEEQDYHGPVTPYLGDLRDLEAFILRQNAALLEWFQHG